jgi:hypothetical protein
MNRTRKVRPSRGALLSFCSANTRATEDDRSDVSKLIVSPLSGEQTVRQELSRAFVIEYADASELPARQWFPRTGQACGLEWIFMETFWESTARARSTHWPPRPKRMNSRTLCDSRRCRR